MGMGMTAEQREALTKFLKDGIVAFTALREGIRNRFDAAIEKIESELDRDMKEQERAGKTMETRKELIDETEQHLHEFSIKCTKSKTWMNELFAAMRKNQDISKRLYERDMKASQEKKSLTTSSVKERKKMRKSEYDLTSREAWKMQSMFRRMARALKIEVVMD